jgi:hypothetical protein
MTHAVPEYHVTWFDLGHRCHGLVQLEMGMKVWRGPRTDPTIVNWLDAGKIRGRDI